MRRYWLAVMVAGLAQGAFVAPTDGPLPFRRDKLPIDVDTMTALSRELVVLAEDLRGETPAGRRTVAQLTALALALDPANRRARTVIGDWQGDRAPERPDPQAVARARTRAWNVLGWLEQPEAGADGQALAACLGDVLAVADPEHPGAGDHPREQGAWGNWVAALDAFRDAPAEAEPAGSGDPAEPEPREAATLALATASVRVPLDYLDRESKEQRFGALELTVRARVEKEGKGFTLQLPGEESPNKPAGRRLQRALEALHGPLPEGLRLQVSVPPTARVSFRDEGSKLDGALVVLGDALFTGKEPAAMVVAAIDEDGGLALPGRFWKTLRAMEALPPGGRVVMPARAMTYLPPLLTLDSAEFLLNQEVLLALDLDALRTLASSEPPGRIREASAAFAQIRQARGTHSIGNFVTRASTQQRLARIVTDCPEHASARLLALRGTPGWPKRLERDLFAREIRLAIEPMGEALQVPTAQLDAGKLDRLEDQLRRRLAELDKLYGSVTDRDELHEPALDTVKLLGSLADDLKRSSEDDRTRVDRGQKAALAVYYKTIRRLTAAVGDTGEYPLPDPSKGP